jgi:pimeloyl-ACP methyl ester carboxylesterase
MIFHFDQVSDMTMIPARDFFIPGPIGKLSMRAKGLDSKPEQLVVLVQGANLCGQTGYDFTFPGGADYSLMDALVAAGYGAVTFAVRGYGLSAAPSDAMDVQTDQAIEDLVAVMDWAAEQGYPRPHLLGWSWGGRIAGRFAEQFPDRVGRLVLLDPALGGGNKVLPAPTEAWWVNTYDDYMKRLEAEFTELSAREAFAALVMANDRRVPNGIRMENAIGSIQVKPEAVTRPTLMIYGHAAARQNYMQGSVQRGDFFERLATDDKALVIIPGGGDYAHLQNPRRACQGAIVEFLKAA